MPFHGGNTGSSALPNVSEAEKRTLSVAKSTIVTKQ